ncbi:MAG: CarD family transcriptional regulator [Flavobacteriales bacterium]|jgi:CarD family transcriptional regulator
MNLNVGDMVVYPAQGVAKVEGLEEKVIGDTALRFFVLRVLDSDKKIMVPENKIDTVDIRLVITEDEVDEVFDILRERNVNFDHGTWNRRYRAYVEKIKTGSIFEIAEVLRDLNLIKADKNLSFGERKMLDTARRLLVQELSIAMKNTEDEVEKELQNLFASSAT